MYKTFSLHKLIAFTKKLKVLYVEDNQEAQEAFLDLLHNFFDDIIVAKDGEDGFEKFQNHSFDLVFSDIKMPKKDGIAMSKRIREIDCTIPIIIVTAHQESHLLLKCIDIGVSAYLLKPINFKRLEKVIKQACEKIYYMKRTEEYEKSLEELVKERTKELEITKNRLEEMANRDPMTNLYNRRYFHNFAENLLNLSQREKKTFSMLMIDIDKFKNINDTYGHMIGDKIIQLLADTFGELIRISDVSVRFGGEEFVILLPGTDLNGASIIADKIRKTVETKKVPLANSKTNYVNFNVSIGVTAYNYTKDKDINVLLHRVDEALYSAKRTGRNKVVVNKGK